MVGKERAEGLGGGGGGLRGCGGGIKVKIGVWQLSHFFNNDDDDDGSTVLLQILIMCS